MVFRRWSILVFLICFAALPSLAADDGVCHERTKKCMNNLDKMLRERGWAGLEMEADGSGGYKVVRVLDESPARQAGFLEGDRVLALNGVRYSDVDGKAALKTRQKLKAGVEVTYRVARAGQETDLAIRLGSIPMAVKTRWISQLTRGEDAEKEFS